MSKKKENKNVEAATAAASTTIKYSGKVTVKLEKNKKVVKTLAQHNTGYEPLFSFFAKSLTEDFTGLTGWVPKYIELGKIIDESYTSCSQIIIKSTATYAATEDGPKTTIHFRIPSSFIYTKSEINAVSLYCQNKLDSRDIKDEPSARVTLEEPLEDIPENYNVIIEWTMSFDNKTKEE